MVGLAMLAGFASAQQPPAGRPRGEPPTWLEIGEQYLAGGGTPVPVDASPAGRTTPAEKGKGYLERNGRPVDLDRWEESWRQMPKPSQAGEAEPDGQPVDEDRWEESWREIPGPPFAGKAEHQYLHWMDLEAFANKHTWLDAGTRRYCRAGVAGQAEGMGFTQYDFSLKYSEEPWNHGIGGAALRYRTLSFHPRPRLPDTGHRFPRQLTSVQLGAQFISFLPVPGFYDVTIGSASDRPFASGDETTADITWSIGGAIDEKHMFAFFVNYQNNRDYLNRCILPGFGYRRRWEDRATLLLGFPFNAFSWRPTPTTYLAATYKFPRTVHAKASWAVWDHVELFAAFDWTSQRYFRHDRRGLENRLWYLEKTVSMGLRWRIADGIFLDASAGWAFDRFWFEGKTYEARDFNRIDLADGPFLGLWLSARF
jgi:hypothetical protein